MFFRISRVTLTVLLGLSFWLCKAQPEEEKTTVDIEYETAVYDFSGEQKKVELTGPIVITTNTLRVTCDNATIFSSRQSGSSDGNAALGTIDYILATGDVEITQGNSKAICGRAEIFPAERKLVLEEDPKIVDPYGTVSGHQIVFLQGERRIKIINKQEEGKRSRIQLNNVEDVGFLMGEPEE